MTLIHTILLALFVVFLCSGFFYFFLSPNARREPRPAPTLRRDLPYRTSAAIDHAVRSQVLLVHSAEEHVVAAMAEIEQAMSQRDKYLHALEAIATMTQDPSSQRVACQALGRRWP